MRGCRPFGCPARAAGASRHDGDEDADVRLAPTGISGRPRPPVHFYRHLEGVLDLAFVRDLVRGTYAERGRPSIDPVILFKLQLILFFEGLRSERQSMRVVADRLSLRWYLGYDLAEPLDAVGLLAQFAWERRPLVKTR
jgi:hypothetical protein